MTQRAPGYNFGGPILFAADGWRLAGRRTWFVAGIRVYWGLAKMIAKRAQPSAVYDGRLAALPAL